MVVIALAAGGSEYTALLRGLGLAGSRRELGLHRTAPGRVGPRMESGEMSSLLEAGGSSKTHG
eukprot:CAMPEP_0115322258 /NCGR_PEP_ID=MMETSP0270-20121206/81305_1 /TAXON_ID=71861 /ORGANISM="Scrippsiella trochoidea, Strain CCMP3099" /LENGTH=62 /DNA_ID=CAMNT_0002742209 /DNA_START=18 /DNA_END=203 /DNA_ORIENTATION=-